MPPLLQESSFSSFFQQSPCSGLMPRRHLFEVSQMFRSTSYLYPRFLLWLPWTLQKTSFRDLLLLFCHQPSQIHAFDASVSSDEEHDMGSRNTSSYNSFLHAFSTKRNQLFSWKDHFSNGCTHPLYCLPRQFCRTQRQISREDLIRFSPADLFIPHSICKLRIRYTHDVAQAHSHELPFSSAYNERRIVLAQAQNLHWTYVVFYWNERSPLLQLFPGSGSQYNISKYLCIHQNIETDG